MMKIAVTGGSGLVGQCVVADLQVDYDVVVIDRKPLPLATDAAEWRPVDIMNLPALTKALNGSEAVVHLAAIPLPLHEPPPVVFGVNAGGTFNVLEACQQLGIKRLVCISSESVLGFAFQHVRQWPLYLPIDEDHPLRPQDAYGLSKLTAELLCAGFSRRGVIQTVCLRPPWIWVPCDAEVARYRELISNYQEWPQTLWAFIHVQDLIQAIRQALGVDLAERHGCFYVNAARNWTGADSRDLARRFFPETRVMADDWQGSASFISNASASQHLGFRPQFGVDDLPLFS